MEPIRSAYLSSDNPPSLLPMLPPYLLYAQCVCVRACVHADPIIVAFVPGVEYGFLCMCTMSCESCLNACFEYCCRPNRYVFVFVVVVVLLVLCCPF